MRQDLETIRKEMGKEVHISEVDTSQQEVMDPECQELQEEAIDLEVQEIQKDQEDLIKL